MLDRRKQGLAIRGLALAATLALVGAVGAPVAQTGAADRDLGLAPVVGAIGDGRPELACFRCHGIDGGGDGASAFPRLAGQSASYMHKQLQDYASGARENAVMSPIARALGEAQMWAVSRYYAGQAAPHGPPPEADPLLLQRGGVLSAAGRAETGVAPCAQCHGPAGAGIPPALPYLAGQNAAYLQEQLLLWRAGLRKNDPLGMMAQIATSLSAEDIAAVALYFASVRLPLAPADQLTPRGQADSRASPPP